MSDDGNKRIRRRRKSETPAAVTGGVRGKGKRRATDQSHGRRVATTANRHTPREESPPRLARRKAPARACIIRRCPNEGKRGGGRQEGSPLFLSRRPSVSSSRPRVPPRKRGDNTRTRKSCAQAATTQRLAKQSCHARNCSSSSSFRARTRSLSTGSGRPLRTHNRAQQSLLLPCHRGRRLRAVNYAEADRCDDGHTNGTPRPFSTKPFVVVAATRMSRLGTIVPAQARRCS